MFWLRMLVTSTGAAFICRWIEIHRIRDRYNRSARLLQFPRSVVCITDTNGTLPNKTRTAVPLGARRPGFMHSGLNAAHTCL